EMLKELQDFASRGCIDIGEVKQETKKIQETQQNGQTIDEDIRQKRARVCELIRHLRHQLEDLEKFAYENGEGELPMSELRQRQKIVFEKLQEKIHLKIELDQKSEQELHRNVDEGLNQLLNPMKEKEKVIDQLQTQIIDLERFVGFLQQEQEPHEFCENPPKSMNIQSLESTHKPIRRKPSSLFGLIGYKSQFEKNALKSTPRGNHYGDQRAQLELAVDKVVQVLQKYSLLPVEPEERDEEAPLPTEIQNEDIFAKSEEEIVAVIRKSFCPALKALLEHGLREYIPNENSLANLAVFGCFSHRRNNGHTPVNGRPLEHIWDVITYFYECRKAIELSDASIGTLSQSFKLDSIDGKSVTSKQLLLSTIENVANSHRRLKRSPDSMWKAFVCAALNERKLTGWIRMIFRAEPIVSKCYNRWSYVAHTGCEDIRPLLERLHEFNLNLPVDLAVRPFQHARDAF
uniref:RUN domain-containing protein n=1 Tax=Acrobeloides nanus TaxID=290746 RepID=A0A914CY44_9BILA